MGFTSGFFKRPQHKRFNLQPRYWDPAKEEREDRERRIKSELGIKDEDGQYVPNIKGRMRSELRHKLSDASGARKKSNIRLLVIFVILAVVAYAYVFGWDELLERIIGGMESLKSNR
ncbi:hypothetical protein [Marinifilum caeruleilacunae]|jgi:hypothetical protein|uniref:Uncharacterized protein n=1 Tax=Marinifilum caeruleilacunae TaxID=2499076 RepID=A0ABX1WS29_9BACT|nr:hypothetical protein [Marinifilum caeruleilacunae]NOU58902.1 hypothetical protein [Marinifilum caeruleilacunae]